LRGLRGSHSGLAGTRFDKWPKKQRILLRFLAYMASAKKRLYKPEIAMSLKLPRCACAASEEIACSDNILEISSLSRPGMEPNP
jgi:hypothetical protein